MRRRTGDRAFSLPELLVVIGIITILMGLMMPAISRAQRYAQAVKCRAQLHQIGVAIAAYEMDNNGFVVPAERPPGRVREWPEMLFDTPAPQVVVCPSAPNPVRENLSYQLNFHLWGRNIRLVQRAGTPRSQVVLAGESRPGHRRLYSGRLSVWWGTSWDPARHGEGLLSNYLWLDYHVSNEPPVALPGNDDPWKPWVTPPALLRK